MWTSPEEIVAGVADGTTYLYSEPLSYVPWRYRPRQAWPVAWSFAEGPSQRLTTVSFRRSLKSQYDRIRLNMLFLRVLLPLLDLDDV